MSYQLLSRHMEKVAVLSAGTICECCIVGRGGFAGPVLHELLDQYRPGDAAPIQGVPSCGAERTTGCPGVWATVGQQGGHKVST